jgi:hypothetical protein
VNLTVRFLLFAAIATMAVAVLILGIAIPIDFGPRGFPVYLATAILLPGGIALGGAFYDRVRKEPGFAAILYGIAFLIAFFGFITPLNHYAILVAGPNIDRQLAWIDRSMGFYWPSFMEWFSRHHTLTHILFFVYGLSHYQIAAVVCFLGFKRLPRDVDTLCLSVCICGAMTVAIWTAFPSFGAITVYGLPGQVARGMRLALDSNYAHALMDLARFGPAKLSTISTKGIVGFPSFHTAEGVFAIWFVRKWSRLLAMFAIFNCAMFLSVPLQGGHHLVDVLGGAVVAVISIWIASALQDYLMRGRSPEDLAKSLDRLEGHYRSPV